MRLSEAIRLGATMKPQAFGGRVGDGTCAREAACDAIGIEPIVYEWGGYESWLSPDNPWRAWAYATKAECPVCRNGTDWHGANVATVMAYHLNDIHAWTRERIADWVELQEPLPLPASVELQDSVTA